MLYKSKNETDELYKKLDAKIEVEEKLYSELSKATFENESLKDQINKLEDRIISFNAKLTDTKSRYDKDKAIAVKSLKLEIKEWKKDLGAERRLKINLERKLSKCVNSDKKLKDSQKLILPKSPPVIPSSSSTSETVCYICSEVIQNYIPKAFHGIVINPTCKTCYGYDDESEFFPLIPQSVFPHESSQDLLIPSHR